MEGKKTSLWLILISPEEEGHSLKPVFLEMRFLCPKILAGNPADAPWSGDLFYSELRANLARSTLGFR